MIKFVAAFVAAANAAASIAAVNLDLQRHDERLAAVLCTIGFLSAIASAAANHLFRRRAESQSLELNYYRAQVDITGEHNDEREAILEDGVRRASRFFMVAPVLLAVAVILFVAGLTLILFR
jgi:hypothetical protein